MNLGAPRALAILLLVVGALIRFELWRESRIADDDALITFRYAENLAHGVGFQYNAGESVLGTTTPLFTLLLAGGVKAGLDIFPWAFALNLASFAASALLLYFLLESAGAPWAGVLAVLLHVFSIAGLMMADVGGMETPFYAALVLAGLLLYARGRTSWAAALAGLATLTRPDGVLLALALALAFLVQRRKFPWRELLVFALVIAPWVIFAWSYFGSPIPNSVMAKRVFFHDHWARTPLEIFQAFQTGRTRILLNVFAVLGAVAVALRFRKLAPLPLWLALYLAFFMAGRVVIHYWYLPPYFTPLFALAALGFAWLAQAAAAVVGNAGSAARQRAYLALVTLAAAAVCLRGHTVLGYARRELIDGQRLLDNTHRAVADWIAGHTAPSARVYVGDIGYVGYFSRRRILDPVGLVSPEAIPWNARRDPKGLIREQQPDACVVALYGLDYQDILRDPWFAGHYALAARFRDESHPAVALADFSPERREIYVPDYEVFMRRAAP